MSAENSQSNQVTTTGRTSRDEPDQGNVPGHDPAPRPAHPEGTAGSLPEGLNPGPRNPGPHNPDAHGVPGAHHETPASKLEDEATNGTESRY